MISSPVFYSSSGASSIFLKAFMATLWGRDVSSIRLTNRSGIGSARWIWNTVPAARAGAAMDSG